MAARKVIRAGDPRLKAENKPVRDVKSPIVKKLIKEGNVRRITVKDSKGKTLIVIPVTLGVVGALIAAPLVVLGAIAAMVTECTITVDRIK